MTPAQKERIEFQFFVLLNCDYDSPLFPVDEDIAVCKKLARMGLVEKNPTCNEYRRTEKGEDFLFSMFSEFKGKKKK